MSNDFKMKILQSLKKGAMKKFPFDPKEVPLAIRGDVHNWQQGGAREQRSSLPEIKGNERTRALHKLSAQTKTRKNPTTGEREFLLHRGASKDELKNWVKHGYVLHDKHTSWTPHLGTAQHFSMHYSKPSPESMTDEGHKGNVVSAWVPESAVHHIPLQFGTIHGRGPNRFAHEYEVVVKPNHGSMVAHPNDVTSKPVTIEQRLQERLRKSDQTDDDTRRIDQVRELFFNNNVLDLNKVLEGASDLVKKYVIRYASNTNTMSRPAHEYISNLIFGRNTTPSDDLIKYAIENDNSSDKSFLKTISNNHKIPFDTINTMMQNSSNLSSITRQHLLDNLYDKHYSQNKDNPEARKLLEDNIQDIEPGKLRSILNGPNVDEFLIRKIEENAVRTGDDVTLKYLLSNKNTPQDIVEKYINYPESNTLHMPESAGPFERVNLGLTALENIKNPDLMDKYFEHGNHSQKEALKGNPNIPPSVIRKLADSGDFAKLNIASHIRVASSADLHHIANNAQGLEDNQRKAVLTNAVRHPNSDVELIKKVRGDVGDENLIDVLHHHDPDATSKFIGKKERKVAPPHRHVSVHPQTDNLKHIKGFLMEIGTPTVRKSELEKRGINNIPAGIVKPNGTVDLDSVDNYEKTLPKERYNLSYDKWNLASTDPLKRGTGYYPQMHDLTGDQMVVQVNPSTEHITKLKDSGLYSTYIAMQKLAQYGSVHPVAPHSLGWARIDKPKNNDKHWHIDEIQSDLPKIAKHIQNYHNSENKADIGSNLKHIMESADPNKVDQVIKVLSGHHNDIEHVIHSSAHELARLNGIESVSMDHPTDQAKQANLNLGKPLPSKHKKIYEERPRKLGYKEVKKEDVFGKAPSLRAIENHISNQYPDEPDDEGYSISRPEWENEIDEPQWGPDHTVQFTKLYKTFRRSQELLRKGAIRRLYGKMNIATDDVNTALHWQEDAVSESREELASRNISKTERERSFNKLARRTTMRKNPINGKREFLLHRGTSPYEHLKTNFHDYVKHDDASSWTPYHDVAKSFALEHQGDPHANSLEHANNHVHSAWINEDNIKTVPGQLVGHEGEFGHEYEVIVGPHRSLKASPSEIQYRKPVRLIKSVTKVAKIADDFKDEKTKNKIATFNLWDKKAGAPTVTPTKGGSWLHTVRKGNIYYHTLRDKPGIHQNWTPNAAAAVARHGGNDHTLLDLTVVDKGMNYGPEMIDAIKEYHKSPNIGLARANKVDHSAENWEDHNSDLYDNLILGYPSHQINTGVMGAAMHGKKLGEKSVVVKPGLADSALIESLAEFPNNEHFTDKKFTPAHREAAFHFLADRVFNLGDYVPKTAVFSHPFTGDFYSAQEIVPHAVPARQGDHRQLKGVKNPEDLYKLAIMDGVLANHDRHYGNYLFTHEGDIRLIDNGLAFDFGHALSHPRPNYAVSLWADNIPKSVHSWIQGLDSAKLRKVMADRNMPESIRSNIEKRFGMLKNWSKNRTKDTNNLGNAFGEINKPMEVKPTRSNDRINDQLDQESSAPETEKLKSGKRKS